MTKVFLSIFVSAYHAVALSSSNDDLRMRRTSLAQSPSVLARETNTRIVGGRPASAGEYPSYAIPTGLQLCGAVLISPDLLLSAAHCEDAFVGQDVYIGGNSLDDLNNVEVIAVDRTFPHPRYNPFFVSNDIMLIKLERKSRAPPVKWNTQSSIPALNDVVTVIGYGLTSQTGDISSKLLEVNLRVKDCDDYDFGLFDDSGICANAIGKDSCYGDSGGPLFGSSGSIVGIVSFGTGKCAEAGETGAYTRVSDFGNFISNGICNLSSDPPASCTNKNNGGKNNNGGSFLGGQCFSAANTVDVLGKGEISMDSLQIGDYVRAGNYQFSRVYSFSHLDHDREGDYLQIYLDSLKNPLEISSTHMVFVSGKSVRASQVKVGDMLGELKVVEIKSIKRRGLYAPVTESGDIVVSGVLASSYAALLDHAVVNQHTAAHIVLAPHRLVCYFNFEICENESYTDGFSDWVFCLIRLAERLGEQSAPVQVVASFLAVPFILAIYFVEKMILFPLLIAPVTFGILFVYSKTYYKSKVKSL